MPASKNKSPSVNDLPMTSPAVPRGRLYLIDGSGYIFRAYHALPPLTRKRDGLPIGAVYGFSNMLNKLLEDHFTSTDATHIAVIFDKGSITFRNDIYDAYKANRDETPEDLIPQFEHIRHATRAFNVPVVEMEGFEADDLIATYARLAREAGQEVVVVSSDKDLMQLVRQGVSMFDPIKARPIGPAEVREKFGVDPDKVVDVQSLAGDSTDNVPGVPGIGIKTAAQLIAEYGDLDTLLARAPEIKQQKRRENLIAFADQARISRELVKLRDDAPIEHELDSFLFKPADPDTVLAYLEDMEFGGLSRRVRARLGQGDAVAATPMLSVRPHTAGKEPAVLLLDTPIALERFLLSAVAEGRMSISVETQGTNFRRSAIVGISLALPDGTAAFVPVRPAGEAQGGLDLAAKPASGLPLDQVLRLLQPVTENAAVLKVGHDIKNTQRALAEHGVALTPIDDIMLLSYALDAGRLGHDLEGLAERTLGAPIPAAKDAMGSGKSARTLDQLPPGEMLAYAAPRAASVLRLHTALRSRLVREHVVRTYETLDRPLVPVLAVMERAGIRVDAKVLSQQSAAFAKQMAGLETEIHKLAGREFNIGSPKQLGEVLFEEMGLDGGKKGKTGAYSTGADILEQLAAQGVELAEKVLDWRQVSKLKNTYTDKLPEEIDPLTGRIHTSYAMAVAATGRLSSNDPNLQNIPIRTEEGRRIRQAFIADKGWVLMSADYSQIELRLLAHMADIPPLTKAFEEGIDIHAQTASDVFGVPVKGMDPSVRRRAKAINFGIIYGISAFGLARQLGIPQGEARKYIDAYFERYPGIRAYMESMRQYGREHGYVETLFGRRCHVPQIREKNPAARSFAERQAINAPLQGAAADIIKRAMIRLPNALLAAGLKTRMLLQVHDELVFEVPKDEVDATTPVVKRVMEGAAVLNVPLLVETGVGANWDEAH